MKKPKLFLNFLLINFTIPFGICTCSNQNNINLKEVKIKIFETSDIHGWIMNTASGQEDTYEYRLSYIANQINKARADKQNYDDVLLIDGGDIYQGNVISNKTNGNALRAYLDIMKYDAVALGNHEFDWGVTDYCADKDATVPAYTIGNMSNDPNIPVLAANLYKAENPNEHVEFTKQYTIVNKAGYKIALIGYIPDYSSDILGKRIEPYKIDDNIDNFTKIIKQINNKEQPDVTIVVAHDEPEELANKLSNKDVQFLTGGHVHKGRAGIAKSSIPYIQADAMANGYATATITIMPNKTIVCSEQDVEYIPIANNIEKIKMLYDNQENVNNLDRDILNLSHIAWDSIKDDMMIKLGYIEQPISKKIKVPNDEIASVAGNWITTLMKAATNTDIAFYNSGGIRTNFDIPIGQSSRVITIGDIYSMLPFNNSLLVYKLTPKQIANHIAKSYVDSNYGDQVSGLTYEYKVINDNEIEVVKLMIGGKEVDINSNDKSDVYSVCFSEYNATLHDSVVENVIPEKIDKQLIDNETVIDQIKKQYSDSQPITVDMTCRTKKIN